MGLDFEYADGQTPLDEDEITGLRISSITTHGELNEFEQQNIEQAIMWTMSRSFKAENLFTEKFIKTLHKRMYSDVWKWAGEFRKTRKNLGIETWQIPSALHTLLADVQYWHKNNTFQPDECVIRFKHRLVSIHCFSNGNGRHSRLMADLIIEKIFNLPVYTWGTNNLLKSGDPRTTYINALKAADNGNIQPLIDFARS
ncbi:MAG: mobile mystery protein B [Cyclobacteriaceae bacterium]|nr:mobile mystery protein B [Cyclobacteriaceae bacterium]